MIAALATAVYCTLTATQKRHDGKQRSFSPVIAANIKQTADALGVSAECAVYLMSIVSLMRLGRYKTRLDYAEAIKDVEMRGLITPTA